VADDHPAAAILDLFQLKPRVAVDFAAVGNGVLDRRELDEIVFAFARTIEHQQHKPDWLQPYPPNAPRQRYGGALPTVNLSLIESLRKCRPNEPKTFAVDARFASASRAHVELSWNR
jgi:hypothetical protein